MNKTREIIEEWRQRYFPKEHADVFLILVTKLENLEKTKKEPSPPEKGATPFFQRFLDTFSSPIKIAIFLKKIMFYLIVAFVLFVVFIVGKILLGWFF